MRAARFPRDSRLSFLLSDVQPDLGLWGVSAPLGAHTYACAHHVCTCGSLCFQGSGQGAKPSSLLVLRVSQPHPQLRSAEVPGLPPPGCACHIGLLTCQRGCDAGVMSPGQCALCSVHGFCCTLGSACFTCFLYLNPLASWPLFFFFEDVGFAVQVR